MMSMRAVIAAALLALRRAAITPVSRKHDGIGDETSFCRPRTWTIDVPTGYAQFPREIIRPPRLLAARTYSDIRRWSVMPRGGHFAALEQPEALANEVREFFRPLRCR
jgi:pimeloyl-ACP methyl ester carboxylesterase